MIELGELEGQHREFEKRNTRVIAASIEGLDKARQTQAEFPHLIVIADAERKMAEAFALIHPGSGPSGGDTAAPTTVLVDGAGNVHWTFRADRVFRRLSSDEVLAAVDEWLRDAWVAEFARIPGVLGILANSATASADKTFRPCSSSVWWRPASTHRRRPGVVSR